MRVLNQGGPANADVLYVERAGLPPLVVKDWGRRSAFVRRVLAPRLIAHELGALRRLDGLPGVPRAYGRVGSHALAMEYLDGEPLRRQRGAMQLPESFFDALEGIADAIAARGLVHLDLRSPTNVLRGASGAPQIVDLGGAFRLPLPAAARRALHRNALRKLRERFAAERDAPEGGPLLGRSRDLKAGGVRFRLSDEGRLDDPVPLLLLHDVALAGVMFERLLDAAASAGRRALAPGLAPFGGSARVLGAIGPRAQARRLEALLDALRITRVDVAGFGFGALVAGALAASAPDRVRTSVTLGGVRELHAACERATAGEAPLYPPLPDWVDDRLAVALPRARGLVSPATVERLLRALDERAFALAPPALPNPEAARDPVALFAALRKLSES